MIYSPDEYSFLQSIIADPDDDLPRLVYADWLEDRGNPRGEFIRVHCELARLPDDAPEKPALLQREDELRRQWRRRWAEPFYDAGVNELWFHRGIVDLVELSMSAFVANAAAMAELALIVRLIRLYGDKAEFTSLLSADLSGLTSVRLDLRNQGLQDLRDLMSASSLTNLQFLHLEGPDERKFRRTDQAMRLARAPTKNDLPGLPALEQLSVSGISDFVPALLKIKFPRLQQVTWTYIRVDADLADRICRDQLFAKTSTRLRLHNCTVARPIQTRLKYNLGSRVTIE